MQFCDSVNYTSSELLSGILFSAHADPKPLIIILYAEYPMSDLISNQRVRDGPMCEGRWGWCRGDRDDIGDDLCTP